MTKLIKSNNDQVVRQFIVSDDHNINIIAEQDSPTMLFISHLHKVKIGFKDTLFSEDKENNIEQMIILLQLAFKLLLNIRVIEHSIAVDFDTHDTKKHFYYFKADLSWHNIKGIDINAENNSLKLLCDGLSMLLPILYPIVTGYDMGELVQLNRKTYVKYIRKNEWQKELRKQVNSVLLDVDDINDWQRKLSKQGIKVTYQRNLIGVSSGERKYALTYVYHYQNHKIRASQTGKNNVLMTLGSGYDINGINYKLHVIKMIRGE